MTTLSSKSLSIWLIILSSLCISICGEFSSSRRKVVHLVTKQDDSTPTNPANFPTYTTTPTIVTIPGASPTTATPTTYTPTPVTTVPTSPTPPTPTTPITNPTAPVTNPATTYQSPTTTTPTPAGTNAPVTGAPAQTSGAPITPGQTWCVAQPGASESALQSALDYACGIGGADCSTIQQGASCYNPSSLENHASYAFNSYFQKNPVPTSCDFGGAAVLVNTNPSVGSCIYPSSATGTGTATPASTYPPATTSSSNGATGSPLVGGTTAGSPYQVPAAGSYGSPPSFTNTSNPSSVFPASYGPDSPPIGNFPAGAAALQPSISAIILVASLSTGRLVFGS